MKKILFLSMFLLSTSIFALPVTLIFRKGFDMQTYQQCKSVIDQCRSEGPTHGAACVKRVVANNAFCDQLLRLSEATLVAPDLIHATRSGNLTIITLHYPADGQNQYVVIGQGGRLFHLDLDARKLIPVLASEDQSMPLLATPEGDPIYRKTPDGGQEVVLNVRITKQCLACDTTAQVPVAFQFDNEGNYLGSSIDQPS